jgi:hypothetical protein
VKITEKSKITKKDFWVDQPAGSQKSIVSKHQKVHNFEQKSDFLVV